MPTILVAARLAQVLCNSTRCNIVYMYPVHQLARCMCKPTPDLVLELDHLLLTVNCICRAAARFCYEGRCLRPWPPEGQMDFTS